MTGREQQSSLGIVRSAVAGSAALLAAHLVSVIMAVAPESQAHPQSLTQALRGIEPHLLGFQLSIALAIATIGAAFGVASWIVLRSFGVRASGIRVLCAVAAITLLGCARTIAKRPALFEDMLWRKGGWRAGLHVFIAERIGLPVVDGTIIVLIAIVIVAAMVRWRPTIVIVLAIAAAALFLQVKWTHRAWDNSRPVVVMLFADSLRPDHLSSSGYARATSPNIDALRAKGAFVDDFFVPIASTTPSWTTDLTGLFPHHHGIRDIFPRRDQIRIRQPTLPTLLAAEGYESAAVSDYAGDFFSRVSYGFTRTDAPPSFNLEMVADREMLQKLPLALGLLTGWAATLFPVVRFLPVNADPAALTSRVDSQLDRLESDGKPFLLTAFYSVTHLPFAAPAPDAAAFTNPGYSGRSRYSYEIQQLEDLGKLGVRPPDSDVEQVRALYDGSLRAFDREVGKILARLDADGITNRIVIIGGDHSEGMFEPGVTTEHGKWFAGGPAAANRTVLVLSGTGVIPGEIRGLASGVDLAPTILDLLHVPQPQMDGISLLRGPIAPGRTVFAETTTWLTGEDDRPPHTIGYPNVVDLLEAEPQTHALVLKRRYSDVTVTARLRAARRENWELVYTPTPRGSETALFDLATDPFMQHEVGLDHPDVVTDLRSRLLDWMAEDPMRWLDAQDHLIARSER